MRELGSFRVFGSGGRWRWGKLGSFRKFAWWELGSFRIFGSWVGKLGLFRVMGARHAVPVRELGSFRIFESGGRV